MPTIPEQLHPGDTVSLIAPASAPPDPKAIDESLAVLERFGFKVRLGRNARKRNGFVAGEDRDRAGDVMRAFTDRKVKAIFCIRGGYGTPRLLPLLDYNLVRGNPKIFVGYSDITALHFAFLVKSNLLTFHGPMFASDFIKKDYPAFSRDSFLRILMSRQPYGSIRKGYKGDTVSVVRKGTVSGNLIGGNASLISCLLGTPYQPDFRGKILFIEDLDEPPYRFDRMLTHMLNAGILQQVAGIAFGVCADCEDPKAKTTKEYRQSLEDVIKERLLPLKVPIVTGLPFGHIPYNATLPVGGRAMLDANRGDLILNDDYVK